MPIRDYKCPSCEFILMDQLEYGYEIPSHSCPLCEASMAILPSLPCLAPTTQQLKYREKKGLFQRRNERIQAMGPEKENKFKSIIDNYKGPSEFGGKRYLP
jgi:hypothetical protein